MGVSPVLGKPPYYQSCQPWINKLLGCVILGVWSKYLSWRVPQSFSTPWLNHSHGIFHEIMKSWCIGCILTQLWVSWASMGIQLYEYHMVYDFPWLSSSPAIRVSRIPHFSSHLSCNRLFVAAAFEDGTAAVWSAGLSRACRHSNMFIDVKMGRCGNNPTIQKLHLGWANPEERRALRMHLEDAFGDEKSW